MDPKLIAKVKRRDRIARRVITGGGLLIIFCVLAILLLIAEVALPLFLPPTARQHAELPLPAATAAQSALAVGMDEYTETAYLLLREGRFVFFDALTGEALRTIPVAPPAEGAGILRVSNNGLDHTLLWSDGSITIERIVFKPEFDAEGGRTIVAEYKRMVAFPPEARRRDATGLMGRIGEGGGGTAALLLPGGKLEVLTLSISENLFGEQQIQQAAYDVPLALNAPVSAMTMHPLGESLYLATELGTLYRWEISPKDGIAPLPVVQIFPEGEAITAMQPVFGGFSLALGSATGQVEVWFPVRQGEGNEFVFTQIHHLARHAAPVVAIVTNQGNKSLLSIGADGAMHLDYPTNERHLLDIALSQPPQAAFVNTRGNGMITLGDDGIRMWSLQVPHPEASLKAFFGKVWYEGYPAPTHTWQSSAATDDFEPKLSLVPLIFGTLKATFYGMLFAMPLAILAAMYNSHLMNPRLRRVVKPTFEIMESLPTVVIGFLAALWLAPIARVTLGTFFLLIAIVPLVVLVAVFVWERLATLHTVRRVLRGYEFITLVPVVLLAVYLSFVIGEGAERILFNGDLPLWLYQQLGVSYDQRNSIIIAFALGLAIVPTVFTISDDALTNVPRNLTAASLALGASRWQTVWKVVLPSASPGIFAALMVGLGRAVGETMIVLMATGNTPILDWSVFNGMRTMSANIAVEIPEAPFNSTLYRTLFFSAVLLFMATFILNSAAEIVRQRLRRKFGKY